MKTSKKGIELIKKYEGFSSQAYHCPAGVLTIGYGHTKMVKKNDKITKEQAEKLLKEDLVSRELCVEKAVKVPLTQAMFDSLVSFVYNVGSGNFTTSTLLKKLNKGDYVGASNEFPRWNKARKVVLNGLVKRREDERKLFLSEGIPTAKEEEKANKIPSLKGYKGKSLVDGLKEKGYASDFKSRKGYWELIGMEENYKGSWEQNIFLLNYLKNQ